MHKEAERNTLSKAERKTLSKAERNTLSAVGFVSRIRAQIRVKMDEKALINVLSGLFDEKLQPVHNRLDRLEGRLMVWIAASTEWKVKSEP